MIQDGKGLILGRYKSVGRDLLIDEIKIVRDFLIGLKNKTKGDHMAKPENKEREKENRMVNRCYIAGTIFKSFSGDKYCKHIVDTGNKNSAPVLFFKSMLKAASEYGEGDYIAIVATASQNKNKETGMYQTILVGEEIKSKAPERSSQTRTVRDFFPSRSTDDDDIPF